MMKKIFLCTECGVYVCKVTFYLPKDNTNTGVYEPLLEFKMEKGSVLNLISTLKTVDGMEFEGWTEGKASKAPMRKPTARPSSAWARHTPSTALWISLPVTTWWSRICLRAM